MKTMTAEKPISKPPDHRRSNKPIMEKRRRARINHCLGELKGLILEAMKKDPARHSKLEKADILEMTVKHLQNLQRQQMAIAVASDPTVMTKFRSGFNECAAEVARYVNRIDGVDRAVRQRLVGHLRSCVNGLSHLSPATFACLMPAIGPGTPTAPYVPPPVHVPSAATAALTAFSQSATQRLNLFPATRLTNAGGDMAAAFMLPNSQHHQGGESVVGDMTATGVASGLVQRPRRPPSATVAPPPPPSRLQPAFPTSALPPSIGGNGTTTVTCPPPSERRTPSAFTSVIGTGGGLTSSIRVATQPPPRAVSPSCSCVVTSTTSPGSGVGFSPQDFIPDGEDVRPFPFQVAAVKKEEEPRFLGMCAVGPLNGSRPGSNAGLTATPVGHTQVLLPKQETANVNQTEAYDLSKPTTSSLCSLSETEKMWRPW